MALVTLQRSPSPSNDPDEESADGGEDGVDGRAVLQRKRSKSTLERLRKIFSTVRFISKLRPCLSESYFTVKGAALILPHNDLNRKTSRKNHGGEIQRHLQSMLYLLRPEDKIKVAIRLENQVESEHRYLALVSTVGRQDTEECVILGLDCTTMSSSDAAVPATSPASPASAGATAAVVFEGKSIALATIGLVMPIWMGIKIRLDGDGGFKITQDDKSFLFKPVSVQAMWSALQSVDKALHQAEHMKYLPEGLTHTWVEYYRSKIDTSKQSRLTAWHMMEDVSIFAPASLSFSNENESEKIKLTISAKLKEVMMSVDLDEATSRSLRLEVEAALNMSLYQYRSYFDEELIRILGQMDAPSQILDYLYLGSEWNASNLEELQQLGIRYILNITREIDNFFTGMFHYFNVRLYDVEESELMKHWLKTYKFINKARKNGSKVLVHCKMGISRSASTVMAYLMKEKRWSLDQAYAYVKERRSCVRPNKGFMEQLLTYEGILNANYKRDVFSKSEQDITEAGEGDGVEAESSQQGTFLGDSLFRVMSGSEWPAHSLTPEEETLLRKSGDHGYPGMEPDLETDSRSADSMEESLPDLPSPVTEQYPSVPPQETAFKQMDAEGQPYRLSPDFVPEPPGAPSRIKPDSSWIKLELPGESTTDPSPPEAMETKETDNEDKDNEGKDSEHCLPDQESSCISFVADSELAREGSLQSKNGKLHDTADQCGIIGEMQDQQVSPLDLGVHQYYSREQIPWNPGKVRNLREEFCAAGQTNVTTTSDVVAKSAETKAISSADSAGEVTAEADKSLNKEALSLVSQCESCLQLSAINQQSEDLEGMEMDDPSKSVYEREDIHMTPGTVQRTRQKIEDRQKQHGEDTDHSIYGLKSIQRSSSVREERDISKNRMSERRKTCTPIVSPPPEKTCNDEEAGEVMDIGTGVLKLDFHVGESTTDDVNMQEADKRRSDNGGEDPNVTVYMFGEESVPVRAGIVRRQKQEIESKSFEASGVQQCALAFGSSENISNVEDEIEDQRSVNHQTSVSSGESAMLTNTVGVGIGGMQNIPTEKQHWTLSPSSAAATEELVPKQSKMCQRTRSDTEGAFSSSSLKDGRESGNEAQQQFMTVKSDRQAAIESLTGGDRRDRTTGGISQVSDKQIPSSESSTMESLSSETNALQSEGFLPFRQYAHSFPSTKKQMGKTCFDSETLAMIREIGSAFIASPSGKEAEVSRKDKESLVKHLVQSIEQETKVPKQERKIVLIDSNADQIKRQSKTEPGPLFSPSPGFISNIEQQLSQSSEQLSQSQVHVMDSLGQPSGNVPMYSADPNLEAFHSSASSYSGSGLDERGGGEQLPSVVKHLRGRFESREELSQLSSSDNITSMPRSSGAYHYSDKDGNGSVLMDEKEQSTCVGSFVSGITKSRSLEEQAPGEFPELLSHAATVSAPGFPPLASSQPPRRPRSAEHVSHPYSLGLRHGTFTPRPRAPKDREVVENMQDLGGSDGAKVRRLHGKNHPLSRLQQQKQGEDSC